MALDIGSKRIGVALSDELGVLATPRGAVLRSSDSQAITDILRLVQDNDAERIVVGYPLGLSGALTQQTRQVERFATRLAARSPVPVEFWDERLTTSAASRVTESGQGSRQSGHRDAVAAAFLLQAYLDRKARPSGSSPASS